KFNVPILNTANLDRSKLQVTVGGGFAWISPQGPNGVLKAYAMERYEGFGNDAKPTFPEMQKGLEVFNGFAKGTEPVSIAGLQKKLEASGTSLNAMNEAFRAFGNNDLLQLFTTERKQAMAYGDRVFLPAKDGVVASMTRDEFKTEVDKALAEFKKNYDPVASR